MRVIDLQRCAEIQFRGREYSKQVDGRTIFGVTNTHCGSVPFTTSLAKSLNVLIRFARLAS
jgi:hypothetical protein